MATKPTKPEPFYEVKILDPKGTIIHNKQIPAKMIDETNFTKHHKVKALLNILSKG